MLIGSIVSRDGVLSLYDTATCDTGRMWALVSIVLILVHLAVSAEKK
ncbi:hypothetical protein RBQ61_08015 [Sedimentibacter sp. MB35-C1]|nr:hypothetical protein [Sedimentibacter sp. MB35-C1]WMJ78861.1 hypothetical protein RBQ61_08015 [Sedimentibacter sp. MB35-C1]